jgi:hypothetical protein
LLSRCIPTEDHKTPRHRTQIRAAPNFISTA